MRSLFLCCVAGLLCPSFISAQCDLPTVGPPSSEVNGSAVAGSSSVLVVGDPAFRIHGAIHVYLESDRGWDWEAEVVPGDGAVSGSFGAALAVRGDQLLVGAPTHDGPLGTAPNRGAVYVTGILGFKSGEALVAPSSVSGDLLGTSVAWGNGRFVAGAPGSTGSSGSVCVFASSSDGPVWEQTLVAADPQAWAEFGASVAMVGNHLVVGAPGADAYRGAVYLFVKSGTTWIQTAKLTASGAQPGDQLGRSVAVRDSGSRLAVLGGAPGFDTAAFLDAGRLVAFERFSESTWSEESISHPAPQAGAEFGASLALDGARILVGCPGQNDYEGAGFVFTVDSSSAEVWGHESWVHESTVECTTGQYSEGGEAVALVGGVAWLGARLALGGGEVQGFVVAGEDCDGNGTFDRCDILQGIAEDVNENEVPDSCELFIRGDVNGDGSVYLVDVPVLLTSVLVQGSDPIGCLAAGDVNVDGSIDFVDALQLLFALFTPGAPPLPAPWPNCGVEELTQWSCETPSACP